MNGEESTEKLTGTRLLAGQAIGILTRLLAVTGSSPGVNRGLSRCIAIQRLILEEESNAPITPQAESIQKSRTKEAYYLGKSIVQPHTHGDSAEEYRRPDARADGDEYAWDSEDPEDDREPELLY